MSERAWLVEWRFNGVQWLYLWPSAPGGFSFTADPNSALRFARREDAEASLAWAREVDRRRGAGVAGGELLVTDHEWNTPASPQAQAAQAQRPALVTAIRGLLASLSREPTEFELRAAAHEFTVMADRAAAADRQGGEDA